MIVARDLYRYCTISCCSLHDTLMLKKILKISSFVSHADDTRGEFSQYLHKVLLGGDHRITLLLTDFPLNISRLLSNGSLIRPIGLAITWRK